MLRQANAFFHEDVIQPKVQPVVVPTDGTFTAWFRTDPGHPPAAVAFAVVRAFETLDTAEHDDFLPLGPADLDDVT